MTDERLSKLICSHFEPVVLWEQKRAIGRDALSDGGYHWCEWHHIDAHGTANQNHVHPIDMVNDPDETQFLLCRLNKEDAKALSRAIAEAFAGNKGLL